MMILSLLLAATMSSSEAIVTVLNAPTSSSPSRYQEALEKVEADAKKGLPVQQFVVGMTTKDEKLAKAYLEASRDKIHRLAEVRNNPLAWYLLSMETNDLEMLKKAAEGGNLQALNAYGALIIQQAFKENYPSNRLEAALTEGYNYFRKAAEKRDPNGFVNLGTCYFRGFGCDIDLFLAHQCFRSAAEAGHPEAMDYVSANYEHGHGVEKDPDLSLMWRMKAKAVRGDKAAQDWLKGRN